MTSGLVSSMYWRAISLSRPRPDTCAANEAGVASVTWAVVTRPVARPRSRAASSTVRTRRPSGATPTAPLTVLTPVAMAVPAAAESVTGSSGSFGSVCCSPATGSASIARRPACPFSASRKKVRGAAPMPSPMESTTFKAGRPSRAAGEIVVPVGDPPPHAASAAAHATATATLLGTRPPSSSRRMTDVPSQNREPRVPPPRRPLGEPRGPGARGGGVLARRRPGGVRPGLGGKRCPLGRTTGAGGYGRDLHAAADEPLPVRVRRLQRQVDLSGRRGRGGRSDPPGPPGRGDPQRDLPGRRRADRPADRGPAALLAGGLRRRGGLPRPSAPAPA